MENKNSSYNQIIKSTTIFGSSQLFVILIGVIRTKILAVLLGPIGVGLIGIFSSIVDIIRSLCGFGMDTAGVKAIAETDGLGDKAILNKTIHRFNLWFRGAAILGFFVCIIFSYPISLWVFGDGGQTVYIAFLSVSVLFALLGTGKSVILQGLRKISAIAKSGVLAAFLSLLLTIPLYLFLGLKSIAITLFVNFLISYICLEFHYKKLNLFPVKVSFKDIFEKELKNIKLGAFIVLGGLVSTLSMFLIRAFIIRNIDLSAAGLFQSAWVITNVYLALILKSMGTDFFPRLSAIASHRDKIKSLVNEQSYILLVIVPSAIVVILLFSDFALSVLYSSDFAFADSVLKWQLLGTFLKVLSWPIAYIILAKNRGVMFVISECLFFIAYLLSGFFLFSEYGLDAFGIGYLIAYVIYLPVVFLMGRSISGFGWSRDILLMTFVNAILIGGAFYISEYAVSSNIFLKIGLLLITLLYAYSKLKKVFSLSDLKKWFNPK